MKFVYTFELLLEEEACLGRRHGGEKVRELTIALRLRATSEGEREKERKRGKQKEIYINCKADTFVQLYIWIELRSSGFWTILFNMIRYWLL